MGSLRGSMWVVVLTVFYSNSLESPKDRDCFIEERLRKSREMSVPRYKVTEKVR